jgi:RHS repeat-associated protein
VGNRTQRTGTGGTVNYTYDGNNKMLTAGGDSFTYDANGNTIARTGSSGNASWTYDYENRTVSSSTPQGSAGFVYNGDGLRVQKAEGGVARKYLFDGVRVYSEHDATMAEQARFMVEGSSYYSPLTAVRVGGACYYPLYDKLGSTRRLADANQTVTDAYWYDAFGNIMSQAGSTVNPFRYVGALGYYRDLTTSLLHLGARYYSPSTGRFTTRDPAGTEGNPYVYASNAPAGSTDPSGRVNWGKLGTCGKEAACAFGAGALACGVTLAGL